LSRITEREIRFVNHLRHLADPKRPDRGALAQLRRGLIQDAGIDFLMSPHVAPFLTERDSDWTVACFYQVAALFAWHQESMAPQEHPWQRNLGVSFRQLKRELTGGKEEEPASLRLRFVALLRADRADLFQHLRQAISLLRTKGIPVDWAQLLHDIIRWDDLDQTAQKAWARSYWSNESDPESNDAKDEEE
jgi:CRISPR system Cascade subunit CasB